MKLEGDHENLRFKKVGGNKMKLVEKKLNALALNRSGECCLSRHSTRGTGGQDKRKPASKRRLY